jgi:hypothetical protein
VHAVLPLFVPHRGQFLAIRDQRAAFIELGAIEPEHAVVGAAAALVGPG